MKNNIINEKFFMLPSQMAGSYVYYLEQQVTHFRPLEEISQNSLVWILEISTKKMFDNPSIFRHPKTVLVQ